MPVIQQEPPYPDFPMPRRWRQFIDEMYYYLECERSVPGNGISLTDAPGRGRLIQSAGGGAPGALNGGFKCVVTADEDIRVYYGVVNSIVPDGMSFGDVPPYVITPVSDSGVVCLAVVVSEAGDEHDGEAISAFIDTFEDMPPDAEPIFYKPIGSYATDSGSLVVTPGGAGNGIGDQQFNLCGGLGGNPEWGPA